MFTKLPIPQAKIFKLLLNQCVTISFNSLLIIIMMHQQTHFTRIRFIGKQDAKENTNLKTDCIFSRHRRHKNRGIRVEKSRGRSSLDQCPWKFVAADIVEKFRFSRFSARRGVGVYRVAAGGFSVCGSRRATHPWPARTPTSPYGSDAQHVTRGTPGRAVDIGGGGAREAVRSGTWHTYCLPLEYLEPKRLLSSLLPREGGYDRKTNLPD